VDFELSEELEQIKSMVSKFVRNELLPLEKEFCIKGKLPIETRKALEQKGKEIGFWALDVPKEYGGAGLGHLAMCVISEELYHAPLLFEFGGVVEPALYFGSDDLKRRYLMPVVEGRKRSCFAFSEPSTGSDFAAIKTRAVKKGDRWVINGSKTFISRAADADFIILFVSTTPEKGAKGISCLLVDTDARGLTLSKPIPTMGDGWDPYTLFFEDCEVPEENLVGEVNQGFAIADHQLTHGRLIISAFCIGIAQRCYEMAVAYAKERKTFGQPIASRQAIQWMLADSEMEISAARLLVHRAAWMADNNKPIRNEAFMAKLYASEMAQRVTDRALQIFGGIGYTRELPIQSFFRQARVWRIGHGTTEINRMMIARNILK